jgi:4-amino-4-deoxy-L-arabinose transferase-like glycosyltransferase
MVDDVVCIVLLIALGLGVGLPRYRFGIDYSDEGCLAYGAVRVMEGQMPNRDFVTLQPPLSYYTAAAMFKLFGTSLASLRILGLGIYVALPLLVYGITRKMAGPVWSLAAAIPSLFLGLAYFNFVPYAIWQGIAATAVAVLLYMRAVEGARRPWLALAAGVMTAASMLLRQDQGLYLAFSILLYTAVLWRTKAGLVSRAALGRAFGLWLAGLAAGLLPFAVWWGVAGAWPEMFRQLVVFPLTTYPKTSALPFPAFRSRMPLAQNASAALCYLPPLVGILVALWLWKQIRRNGCQWREARIVFILTWSAFFYCQALTRSDLHHLLIALVPFFILCACGWNAVMEMLGDAQAGKTALSVLAAAIAVCFLWVTKPVFMEEQTPQDMVDLHRAGVRMRGAGALAEFVRYVQGNAPADRSILCLPYQPMYYFLCERRNPTRWNYLWPGDQTAEERRALIEQARRDPPAVVLIFAEPDIGRFAPEILDYVKAGYRKDAKDGWPSVYLPK